MTPNEKPAMTEFSTVTAARSMVLRWPAKVWVIAPREYWQREVKTAGPARYQSFLDSTLNSRKKSPTLVIGAMSSGSGTNEDLKEASDGRRRNSSSARPTMWWSSLPSLSRGESNGCLFVLSSAMES